MWGEAWGSMVWGLANAVPGLGPAGLALLAALLVGTSVLVRRQGRRPRILLVGLLAVAVPLAAVAGTVTLPHVFSNGSTADAGEVNANFQALTTESNDQDARLTALESATINYQSCTWSSCLDSPSTAFCPGGMVMIGVQMPEYGGDQGGCNTNPSTGVDDYRIRCCSLRIAIP